MSDGASTSKPPRELPDAAICRAKTIGLDGYAECLVHRPIECRYALPFGNACFCQNPKRAEIIARTKSQPPPGGIPQTKL